MGRVKNSDVGRVCCWFPGRLELGGWVRVWQLKRTVRDTVHKNSTGIKRMTLVSLIPENTGRGDAHLMKMTSGFSWKASGIFILLESRCSLGKQVRNQGYLCRLYVECPTEVITEPGKESPMLFLVIHLLNDLCLNPFMFGWREAY